MNATDDTKRTRRPADATAQDSGTTKTGKALRAATGRDYADWFALLDAWGAAGRAYREIAAWLTDEHGISAWWAQKLIVEYEQARGLRDPGARPDGTFAGGASKSVAVPVDRLFEAFIDPALRDRWLPRVVLRERVSTPGRSARFDMHDGTRLNVTFRATGDDRSEVAVEHDHLPDTAAAESRKAYFRDRLTELKRLLEADR